MSSLQLKYSNQLVASFFATSLALFVGCSGLKSNYGRNFIKPLTASSPQAKHREQTVADDRMLCIETAKSVAEQGHATEAIKLYERAEELGSSQPPLDKQLAPLHAQAGNFDAAIARYQRLVTNSPNDIHLCNNFAWTLMEAKQFSEAFAEAQRGLALVSNDIRLRTTLAMIHYRQGDRTSAWDQFAKAQGPIAAHHNLAVLDIDAGNAESAREHLRLANQIAGNDPSQASPQSKALLVALNQHDGSQKPVQP